MSIGRETSALIARPTAATVLVNGQQAAFDAFNINDNNYFKLRDLAYALKNSEKQFDIDFDGVNNSIDLTSGKAYTIRGGEMIGKGSENKVPMPTNSKIYLDGREIHFSAYNIDNNNYFMLRDVARTFDFYVGYSSANQTITIDTRRGYEVN